MKLDKRYLVLGTIACGLFPGLAAHADEFNQETTITFSAPVQIPGMVLAAGTYTFKLADPDDNQSDVEVLNASQTKVYTILETVPADRTRPTGHTEVKLADTGAGNVPTLTEWFYPGETTGYQFLYPAQKEHKLDQAKDQTIIARPATSVHSEAGE